MTLDRRRFLTVCTQAGISSALLPGALYTLAAQAQEASAATAPVSEEMIDQAAALAGISISAAQKKLMLNGLKDQRNSYTKIRELEIPNQVAPAFFFHPVAASRTAAKVAVDRTVTLSAPPTGLRAPADLETLAFSTVRDLAEMLRTRKVSAMALTEMYLHRLRRYNPQLHFAITLTEERAFAQAREADREITAGRYRGPLHGIPWGAKDLLAVKGYPTTWGAGGLEHQSLDEDATVVQRLDAAGAILIAKLTLGALAMGDVWFGGRTRNPWNPKQGSSGSSAGSASATAAGCVAFAIGSETLGSISSPATRCGATGLRPTFGLVPRTGAMALSWTMDKLGPLCRSVEDCALVLSAIYGPDGKGESVFRYEPFRWNAALDWKTLRLGYLKEEFDPPPAPGVAPPPPSSAESKEDARKRQEQEGAATAARMRREYDRRYDQAALAALQAMGATLIPVKLPSLPYGSMAPLLTAEAAAAFDSLTRSGRDALLTRQGEGDWPNLFRVSRFYPAVEYIQANRARSLAGQAMNQIFEQVDVLVAPTPGVQLLVTNLTGHPAVILPNGIRGNDAPPPPHGEEGDEDNIGGPGTPVSLTFLAGHYQEARLLAVARAYEQATGFHRQHPPKFRSSS